MITEDQFEALSKYETSSWAIWSDDFLDPDCRKCRENEENNLKKYFSENLRLLKNNIILLGLNPSGNKEDICDAPSYLLGNFHTVIYDYGKGGKRRHQNDLFLSENIMKLDNLKGAYMTDTSDVIESDSYKVSLDGNDVKNLLEDKINILGSEKVHIVCFGKKVFDIINKKYGKGIDNVPNEYDVIEFSTELENKHITFYKVNHYSYLDKKDIFRKQLEYVNKAVQNNA